MNSLLKSRANEYIHFVVDGKNIAVPYAIASTETIGEPRPYYMGRPDKHTYYAGKGTPQQIRASLLAAARAKAFDLTAASPQDFATITILDKSKGLEAQKWAETTQDGQNYGAYAFDPARGDSVRRLRYSSKAKLI
jgi:hypothetical protein